jgi:uncharacterized protein YjbJ (UPF0337 family)
MEEATSKSHCSLHSFFCSNILFFIFAFRAKNVSVYQEWHVERGVSRENPFLMQNVERFTTTGRKENISDEQEEHTMNDEQKGLGTLGREDALKGKRTQTSGWFQKVVGKMIGSQARQTQGAVQEAGGKIQSKVGEAEQKADQATEHDEKAHTQ